MLTNSIRQVGRLLERLSGGNVHGAVAINNGRPGSVTVVSSEDVERLEGEALPERTQMSVLRIPGDTLPVVPPELD
jgi:hypothetical protein